MTARKEAASKRSRGPVVLLTDFGDGPFQGVMKGVILSRAPDCRIVALSGFTAAEMAPRALACGAHAYVEKGTGAAAVRDAVRAAAATPETSA